MKEAGKHTHPKKEQKEEKQKPTAVYYSYVPLCVTVSNRQKERQLLLFFWESGWVGI